MTIAFTLVDSIGHFISERFGVDLHHVTIFAQLFCPLTALTNAFFFLFGMNLYNHLEVSMAQHCQFIRREYFKKKSNLQLDVIKIYVCIIDC